MGALLRPVLYSIDSASTGISTKAILTGCTGAGDIELEFPKAGASVVPDATSVMK